MTRWRGSLGHMPLSGEPEVRGLSWHGGGWRFQLLSRTQRPPTGGETLGGAFCWSHGAVPSCLGSCGLSLLDVMNLRIVVSVLVRRPRAAWCQTRCPLPVGARRGHFTPGASGLLPRAAFALPLHTRATMLPYAGSGCLTSPVCAAGTRFGHRRTNKGQAWKSYQNELPE